MYNTLLDQIMPVTRRYRSRRLWWIVALIAIVVGCLAFTAIGSARNGDIDGMRAAMSFAGIAIVAAVIAWIGCRLSYRDPRPIAANIEETFPNLNQRLLTAISEGEAADDKPLGYLQTRVICEARDHSLQHNWANTLPAGKLWMSRLAGWGATALLVYVLAMLASASPTTHQSGIAGVSEDANRQIQVEPGNAEIERGTSLAITARFAVDAPKEAELVCTSTNQDGKETVRRINMTQNLNDPIVGGFIASVDAKFTYQVVTKDWTSESFSIDVFEFPSLVRSDAELDYPEYTGLDNKWVEDTVRVSAVEGTKVKWLCFLNKSVLSGELIAKDGTSITLEKDDDVEGALSTEFDLRETKRLTLKLVDEAGRQNKYPPELIARVLKNQPPKLKLTNARDSSVSPLEELPLGVEVRDDFGIAQVGLSYRFADEPAKDLVLKENIGRGSREKVDHLIAFEDLNAEPDQLLAYHFWAEDVGPDGQARRTESDMFFAEVRPFEEIYREGEPPAGGEQQQQQQEQNQNGQKAEELAELQKQIINATWTVIRTERGEEPTKEFTSNIQLLTESQGDALNQLEELAGNLEDDESRAHAEAVRTKMQTAIVELGDAGKDNDTQPLHPAMIAEQAAYGGLLKLRAREFQVTRQQQQQQQGQQSASQQNRQQQLDDLELKQEENRYETQQQAQPTSEEEQQQREVRQVLNRLRDLAKRQEDLNKQLAELQSALEQAETEEEKEEIERQLKRLRDQEQDLLRETDELAERMQSPENADQMTEASEQLDQTRENVRKASEALENKDASEALTAGKRAEREFEEMRDEFRQKAAGQFNESVRDMRSSAQQLDEQQQKLAEQLEKIDQEDKTPGLRANSNREGIEKEIDTQREQLGDLLEKMQQTVEEAEVAEPLLAQKLYESFRKTQQAQIDRKLKATAELLNRGFDAEAKQLEAPAREGIRQLRQEIEEAAESILGDETEGLRRALGELDQLSRDLDREIDDANPNTGPGREPGQQPGQPGTQDPNQQQPNQQRPGQSPGEQPSEQPRQPSDQERDEPQQGQQPGQPPGQPAQQPSEQLGQGQGQNAQAGQQPGESGEGEPRDGNQPGQERNGGLNRFAADNSTSQPIAGGGFRDWSDRLRDVEEMVEDAELRSRAARIRDRAREVRIDLKRQSKDPQWGIVEEMIAQPLRELKRDVQEELMRRSAEKNALVPIDRDPVPNEFSDAVQRYYENLGSGR